MTLGGSQAGLVLLSGGLDSATVLAAACDAAPPGSAGRPVALSFDYGQRHRAELTAARALATYYGVRHLVSIMDLFTQIGGSALTDDRIPVPTRAAPTPPAALIPPTYVPGRNLVFLAHAVAAAEALRLPRILLGINAVDYSGYPDCRPEFLAAFIHAARLATRVGTEGQAVVIEAPLLHLSKADIARRANALLVPVALTVSCYRADATGRACGFCDSCRIRRAGFEAAGLPDPTRYVPGMFP